MGFIITIQKTYNITRNEKNITLDGGMLKKLSSGGDPVVARTLFKEQETLFLIL